MSQKGSVFQYLRLSRTKIAVAKSSATPATRGAMPRASQRGFLIPLLLVLIVLATVYGLVVWKWSYSSGERVGIVQKISKKGWVCKTWEGELNMVMLPGGIPEKFYFTVWDEGVAASVNKTIGKRVSLHYEEKLGLPTSCFGDTRHFVTKVVVLE
jgi:hypothetical protein